MGHAKIATPWLRISRLGLAALLALGCAGRADDVTQIGGDSESHFLAHCQPGGCADGLLCQYGVCTAACTDDAECRSRAENATCCTLDDEPSPIASMCDAPCAEDAECSGLGPSFRCAAGFCRESEAESGLYRACSAAHPCAEGTSCIDNTCSQRCETDADCEGGAHCQAYADASGSRQDYCVYSCEAEPEDPSAAHATCSFLGAGGRCSGGVCRETLSSECSEAGLLGSGWSCYQDVAADAFRRRREALLSKEVCIPPRDARVYDYDYRSCAGSTCESGEPGCPVRGLSLESEAAALDNPDWSLPSNIVMMARGEVSLRQAVRIAYDLVDPVERCEFSATARFWNIAFLDGYEYMSPEAADRFARYRGTSVSTRAIASGYWQVVHYSALGHVGPARVGGVVVAESTEDVEINSDPPASIEDSSADVEVIAGGQRCRDIREHVGIQLRLSLTTRISTLLDEWFAGAEDTLQCTVCGQLDCELACRLR